MIVLEMLGPKASMDLLDGQVAAGSPNDILRFGGLQELEAVAEGVSLADQRVYFHRSMRQGEFHSNHFVQRDFLPQHGGNAGLANVDGVPANHRPVAGIDANVDFQLEARMAAGFDKFTTRAGS